MSATAEFRLSITRALSDQLAQALAQLVPVSLSIENVATLQARGGVYQLYRDGELVYIGKADRSLVERLGNHRRKISGRLGIDLEEMTFTALYVDEDLSAVAPEALLIKRHRGEGEVPWNYNGFGNKDPGRERDTSRVDRKHFDSQYPANLMYICQNISAGTYRVGDLLYLLKASLPYVFRYQDGNRQADSQPPEYWQAHVTITDGPTTDLLFSTIANALVGWQITALPGYVIMYRESRPYASARKVYGPTLALPD